MPRSLLSAVLFGAATPLMQRAGHGLGPFATAALLYAGAAVGGAAMARRATQEASLRRGDGPRLVAMALFGAGVGPAALAWGLQRTGATSASLLATLEAVFTALLAWRVDGETVDRRVASAMALLLAGGLVIVADGGRADGARTLGLLAVAGATLAWGLDNTLSRGVADRDPGQVVLLKSALGATITGALAVAVDEAAPSTTQAAMLLAIGALAFGTSLRLHLLAQRSFGASRTASVFASAPFVGALVAIALGDRTPGVGVAVGGVLMALGVVLHVRESHDHAHDHEALEHEHAHRHDDGHHDHVHDPMPIGPHSHLHRHAPRRHRHPHVPDAHHRHRH